MLHKLVVELKVKDLLKVFEVGVRNGVFLIIRVVILFIWFVRFHFD